MKQITEDYVLFETAQLLKEKGFDGECQGYYEVPTKLSSKKDVCKQLNVLPKNWNEYNKECVVCEYVSIPTHQMALKWLREVHNLTIDVFHFIDWKVNIKTISDDYFKADYSYPELKPAESYEEACEAALLYVLKNLI